MSSSIKQFANILISFIDKMFMPLIDSKITEAAKALDQWVQLKNFIYQSDQIQIWKVQKFLLDMPLRPLNTQIKRITTEQSNKQIGGIRSTSFYENDGWKGNEGLQVLEQEKKQNFLSGGYNNDIVKSEEKSENRVSLDSFENLLSSFRKLCTNFQNNHKKLIMDREAFSH